MPIKQTVKIAVNLLYLRINNKEKASCHPAQILGVRDEDMLFYAVWLHVYLRVFGLTLVFIIFLLSIHSVPFAEQNNAYALSSFL